MKKVEVHFLRFIFLILFYNFPHIFTYSEYMSLSLSTAIVYASG